MINCEKCSDEAFIMHLDNNVNSLDSDATCRSHRMAKLDPK